MNELCSMQSSPTQTICKISVMEAFYSLQGEGFHQGCAAYFIRLGGCDVGCTWCDVKESWDASLHRTFEAEELVQMAILGETLFPKDPVTPLPDQARNGLSYIRETAKRKEALGSKRIAVITGGEPLLQDCTELTRGLRKAGFRTHLETSGAHPITGEWDWVCLSPKKFKYPLPDILPEADELKVVVFNKTDFAWAEKFASRVSPACKLYLQPEWGKSSEVTPLIIEYIKANPQWEFSLQLHKYIHVP
jgi:7-carboxy-7-deazaguanine synthase